MFDTVTEAGRTVASGLAAIVVASTFLVAAAGPVHAAEVAPNARVVSYGDLDLAHARGRTALEFRIKSAARSVCDNGLDDARARATEIRCVRSAVESAKRAVATTSAAYQG